MIKIINEEINEFIEFLNKYYPLSMNIFIHFVEDTECIEIPDKEDEYSYGITIFEKSNKESPNIYISTEIPNDEDILHIIAHEYAHCIQWCNLKELDENEANDLADFYIERFNCDIRKTTEECEDCGFCEKNKKGVL